MIILYIYGDSILLILILYIIRELDLNHSLPKLSNKPLSSAAGFCKMLSPSSLFVPPKKVLLLFLASLSSSSIFVTLPPDPPSLVFEVLGDMFAAYFTSSYGNPSYAGSTTASDALG